MKRSLPCVIRRLLLLLLVLTSVPGLPAPDYDIEVLRAIPYVTRETGNMQLDFYRPLNLPGALPVVLAVHGGFWREGDRTQLQPLCEQLAARGYAVVSIDYRLLPQARYPEQIADVRAAASWIQKNAAQYRLDAQRIVAFGVSAGGHLAAMLAVQPQQGTPRMIAAVTFSSPMDFTVPPPDLTSEALVWQFLGVRQAEDPEAYAQASPLPHVTQDDPPFFIEHGTADEIVPFSQAERMVDALKRHQVPIAFYPIRGGKHVMPPPDSATSKQVLQALFDFLQHYVIAPDQKTLPPESAGASGKNVPAMEEPVRIAP